MKFIKILLITAYVAVLTACSGGGNENSSVDHTLGGDDTQTIVQTTVAPDGTLDFTGSDDFEGFALSASDPALAGRTIYIEKSESEYYINGYVSLSAKYAVRFTAKASDTNTQDLHDVRVTLPFSPSILLAEGGASTDVLVCSIMNGTVSAQNTSSAGATLVRADATIPSSFFSGFLKIVALPETSGTINIAGRSYQEADEAGEYLTDPNGVNHPDTARGIDHVQPGERVMLALNETAFGDWVAASNWHLSVPEGSASVLTEEGDFQTFIPDTVGLYQVTLEIEGINGDTSAETATIVAQNYSSPGSGGEPTCLNACHNGNISSSESQDRFGRRILRDVETPWRATAHADAFTPIASVTYSGCLKCHTTGFLFADRDRDGADEYMVASGFDDTITDWSNPASTGSTHLRGVSCEACHGPSTGGGNFDQSHYSQMPLSSQICLSCHGQASQSIHFFGYSDAHDQAHTLSGGHVAKNAGCFKCHTGEGMLSRIFDADITPSNTASVTGIGCAVCHDPHGEGGNESQLRMTGTFDIPLISGNLTVNAGKALICYNCHNADTQLPAVGTIPHNTQVEMLNGVGGYDYGENLTAVSANHSRLACSYCHMSHSKGTTHDMNMTTNAAERIASCQASPCHSATPPQFSDGHYDLNGNLTGVRTGIQQLADTINEKAGLPQGSAIKAVYSASSDELVTALNYAAYNYNFILSDSSGGFHNPVYAQKLITLSLQDLERY